MSSELPFYISTTSSEARRRHQHHHPQQQNNQTSSKQQIAATSNSAQFQQHPHSSSPQQIAQSASYGNFSSLIVPAASNFWNAAQTSIQSFTEQISSDFISASEERDRRSNSSTPSNIPQPIDIPIDMPFRDRTTEFRTVAKSCQLRHQPDGYLQSSKAERDKVLQSSVQFNQLAKRIGRDLGMTCAKMEKLSQLAKNKSIFDDRAGEIEELSMTIKQDITGLNKQIANLQQVATHRPQNELSPKQEQQCQNHSKLVVVGLQSKLASISQTFKSVLEIRTENMKMKRARRERFAQSGGIPASLPPSASNGNMGSLLLHDDMHASNGGIGGSSSFAMDMDQLEQRRIQEQATLIDESETYHRSRYTAMESIESSISELGTIFRQLATLVSEQGEMITRIDSNVEETAINVEAAHHELLRYFNNISRNRWLIIKVFGVLMAFFIFFVIFMT